MFRGYWCLFVALIGWLSLAAANQPTQKADHPKAQQEIPAPPVAPKYAAYPDWQAETCYGAKDHDAADLCAQWRAAIASEKTAHEARRATTWSIAATVFSAFAFGVLVWSLIQTERSLGESRRGNVLNMRENARATRRAVAGAKETAAALRAANRSAKAAADQVKVAQDTAYRELRAYLGVTVTSDEACSEILCGKVIIKNEGATPAQIRVFTGAWVGPFPTGRIADLGPPPMRDDHHHTYINRNGEESVQWFYPPSDVPPDEIVKLAKPKSETGICLYVYGRIEFTDFLRHERVLHFSYRLNGLLEVGKQFEMIPDTYGNEYEDRSKSA